LGGKFSQWVVHDVKKEDLDVASPETAELWPFLPDYRGDNGKERQTQFVKALNRKITEVTRQWLTRWIDGLIE
jgi:hypothetical protein